MVSNANASLNSLAMARHTASPQPIPTTSALHYPAHTMATTTMGQYPSMVGSAGPMTSMGHPVSWQPATSYQPDMSGGRQSLDYSQYVDAGQSQIGAPQSRYDRMPMMNQSPSFGTYFMPGNGQVDYTQRSTHA